MLCLILFACVACSKRDTVVPQTTQAVDRTVIERKKKQAIFQRAYRHASKDIREAIQPAGIRARKKAQTIIFRRQARQNYKQKLLECSPSKKQLKTLKNKRNKRVKSEFTVESRVYLVSDGVFNGDLHNWYKVRKNIRGKPSLIYLDFFGEGQATNKCRLFKHGKKYQFTGKLRRVDMLPGVSYHRDKKKRKPRHHYILKVESWKSLPHTNQQ